MLELGDLAPDFELEISGGGSFHLEEALETVRVLLYFFPKNLTPL
jgi:peroxiredoxin